MSNSTGGSNTATGSYALPVNTGGIANTAIGDRSLAENTTGNANTAIGESALAWNNTGSYNTALGHGTGNSANHTQTAGSLNTFIGAESGPGTSTQLTNATAIGANAVVGQDNALVLGSINGVNGATASVNVGIGTQTPAKPLHVATGDIYASQAASGVIVKSPDGTKCARIGIENNGALSVTAVTCP